MSDSRVLVALLSHSYSNFSVSDNYPAIPIVAESVHSLNPGRPYRKPLPLRCCHRNSCRHPRTINTYVSTLPYPRVARQGVQTRGNGCKTANVYDTIAWTRVHRIILMHTEKIEIDTYFKSLFFIFRTSLHTLHSELWISHNVSWIFEGHHCKRNLITLQASL
jgi:hypothetical protein